MNKLALATVISCGVVCAQQVDWVKQIKNQPFADVRKYDFAAQKPGGSLTGGVSANIALAPCPAGVNGADTAHYLYISGGTGTAEPVLVTGGTCVAGAATGTVTVTPANSHSGAWTVTSATAGIEEAIYAAPSAGAAVRVPYGQFTIHAPVATRLNVYTPIRGSGTMATMLNVASDFPLTAKAVIVITGTVSTNSFISGGISDLTIKFIQPDSTNFATYTQWPPAIYTSGTWHPRFNNLEIVAAWDGVVVDGNVGDQGGFTLTNVQMSAFHRGISIDADFQPTIISNVTIDPDGLTGLQTTTYLTAANGAVGMYIGRVDDLKISKVTTDAPGTCIDLHTGDGPLGSDGFIEGLWCDLSGVNMSDGNIQISNSNLGKLNFTGGMLHISGAEFSSTTADDLVTAAPIRGFNSVNTSLYNPTLIIERSMFASFGQDVHSVLATTDPSLTGNFTLNLIGNTFKRSPNIAYSVPTIVVNAAGTGSTQATIVGNSATPLGTGSGTFIFLNTDDFHTISGNTYYGWSVNPATGTTKKTYIDNILVPTTTSVSSTGGSIVPTGHTFHVTGTGTVTNFTINFGFPYRQVTTIPDGAFTYTASGTIGASGTAVVGKPIIWTYDSGKWYPSY